MTILKDILSDFKTNTEVEKVRIISDKIMDEEIDDMDSYVGPKDPNYFISIPVYEDKKFKYYLTLERELQDTFVAREWKKGNKSSQLIPINVYQIRESKSENILGEFIRILRYVRGD